MPWLKGIQGRHTNSLTYTMPNECCDTPMGSVNYIDGCNCYTGKYPNANINEWKDDLIWLPASAEIGKASNEGGLWELDNYARRASNKYWFRTGVNNDKGTRRCAKAISADGKTLTDNNVATTSLYIRPGIHLNLNALQGAATNTTTATKPYWSASQSNYYRVNNVRQLHGRCANRNVVFSCIY